jgi:hypothetical protein
LKVVLADLGFGNDLLKRNSARQPLGPKILSKATHVLSEGPVCLNMVVTPSQ